jgi:hypothetical protein
MDIDIERQHLRLDANEQRALRLSVNNDVYPFDEADQLLGKALTAKRYLDDLDLSRLPMGADRNAELSRIHRDRPVLDKMINQLGALIAPQVIAALEKSINEHDEQDDV